jgi:hypothetical protein
LPYSRQEFFKGIQLKTTYKKVKCYHFGCLSIFGSLYSILSWKPQEYVKFGLKIQAGNFTRNPKQNKIIKLSKSDLK